MDMVSASVGPLSTFMWDTPHFDLLPPGFTPGSVGDAMVHVSDLTLRFDVLVEAAEFYSHPVRYAMKHHPIHTMALNKRQFDVMRYGMVIDEVERLVLVLLPRICGDSGAKVTREYSAIFGGDFNDAPCAMHPILPEYCFVVYQLPKKNTDTREVSIDQQAAGESTENGMNNSDNSIFPVPLFRLVFRNEAYNEHMEMRLVDSFPLFRLRSVYVSHAKYYSMQSQLNLYARMLASGECLPNPKIEEALGISKISWLFDTWLMVLEGIAPSWLRDKGVGPDIVTLFLASHRPVGNYDVKDILPAYTQLAVDNRVRCSYYASGERMQQRVHVIERLPDMIDKWRQGAYDIRYFGEEVTGPEPTVQVSYCVRMLLCRRKNERNYIEGDEIAAFIPSDEECEPLRVYNTLAAERLRLWVLKGLMTAELHGVHCLMVEFDTVMVVSECVGLLWGTGEDDRQREVVFHVCRIIVETVEDYVQHSGVIWRAIIVTSDEDSLKAACLCRDILEVTQMAKTRVEIEERHRVAAKKTVGSSTPSDEGVTTHGEEEDKEKIVDGALVMEQVLNNGFENIVPKTIIPLGTDAAVCYHPFERIAKFSESIKKSATRCGVLIRDAELYPIFLALSGGEETVPISTIVDLILEKDLESDGKTRSLPCCQRRLLWPNNHPICSIDSCGVPCDSVRVWNFVKSFQRRPYITKSRDFRATMPLTLIDAPDSLSYVEFSLLMLALARQ